METIFERRWTCEDCDYDRMDICSVPSDNPTKKQVKQVEDMFDRHYRDDAKDCIDGSHKVRVSSRAMKRELNG